MKALFCTLALAALAPNTAAQQGLYDLFGADRFDLYGGDLLGVDDRDGDGFRDFYVLAQNLRVAAGPNQDNAGVIELRSGAAGALLWTFENPDPDSFLFGRMSPLGDINGDGVDDLLVAAAEFGLLGTHLYRVSGADGAFLGELVLSGPGEPYRHATSIHDVNGDGLIDVAVQVERALPSGVDLYEVHVVDSTTGATLIQIQPPQGATFEFARIGALGDIDGDGGDDFAVADLGVNGLAGAVYFYSGLGAYLGEFAGQVSGERLGFSIAALPDLDGDGAAEIAVSSPSWNATPATGKVTILDGATRVPMRVLRSATEGDFFGFHLAVAGDVNGDGGVDLAVGAPDLVRAVDGRGRVALFDVLTGNLHGEIVGSRPGEVLGEGFALLSDSNGNGFREMAASGSGNIASGPNVVGRVAVFEGPIGPPCTTPVSYCAPIVPNSSGRLATLVPLRPASLSGASFRMEGGGMPPGAFTLLLASRDQDFVPNPGGSQGTLCLGGTLSLYLTDVRTVAPSGRALYRAPLTAIPTLTGPISAMAGEVWNFQAWYRDANPQVTSNFTSALSVRVCF